jgi:uncharacterized membrane protein YhaH (DUF805 family)
VEFEGFRVPMDEARERFDQPIVGLLYSLALLIPGLAVAMRRLHDTGRSGWWLLIGLVPCIGLIVLIVFFATEGDRGPNQYGSAPLSFVPA